MTASADLPALLQRAAQAMPERFRDAPLPWLDYTYPHTLQAFLRGDWELIWADGSGQEWPQHWDLMLEAACREECEARRLGWSVGRWMVMGPPFAATVTGEDHHEQYGASPAEALLLALLEAVGAGE